MVYFTALIIVSCLLYLIYEKRQNDKYIASFTHVIHVNGIRGKTSVCRYLDTALRELGYRVFTKTTGTLPFIIDVDGNEHLIKRKGNVNIKEQLKIIKQAHEQNAGILIIECMAITPEYQKISQESIVKSDVTVITNVRYDHVFDMGESLEEIAQALSLTIPKNGVLFTADPNSELYFSQHCNLSGTALIDCSNGYNEDDFQNLNKEIAKRVAAYISGDSRSEYDFTNYKEDFGSLKLYRNIYGQQVDFLNLFSTNDPISTGILAEKTILEGDYENVYYLYNHRDDRGDRLHLFINKFFDTNKYSAIFIIGDNTKLPVSLLSRKSTKAYAIKDLKQIFPLPQKSIVIGIGNIKNHGYKIIEELERGSMLE